MKSLGGATPRPAATSTSPMVRPLRSSMPSFSSSAVGSSPATRGSTKTLHLLGPSSVMLLLKIASFSSASSSIPRVMPRTSTPQSVTSSSPILTSGLPLRLAAAAARALAEGAVPSPPSGGASKACPATA